MTDESFRVDLPTELGERVKAAADEAGESVEAVVSRALEAWLADDVVPEQSDAGALEELERRWAAVQGGERTVSQDEVLRWVKTWGTAAYRPWRVS